MTAKHELDRQAQPWALGIGLAGAALMLAAAAAASRKRSGAGRGTGDGRSGPVRRPGDEAEAGAPQTGEGLCPACSGNGRAGGAPCEACAGTGIVIVNVGDA